MESPRPPRQQALVRLPVLLLLIPVGRSKGLCPADWATFGDRDGQILGLPQDKIAMPILAKVQDFRVAQD